MAAKPTEASQLGSGKKSEWHNEPRLIESSSSAACPSAGLLPKCPRRSFCQSAAWICGALKSAPSFLQCFYVQGCIYSGVISNAFIRKKTALVFVAPCDRYCRRLGIVTYWFLCFTVQKFAHIHNKVACNKSFEPIS